MTSHRDHYDGIVYSTAQGKMCPRCGKRLTACTCRKKNAMPKGDGKVRVGREKKGRKGKGVTVITGIPLGHAALRQLAKELKQKCGAGGTVKDGVIEIQGDHRDFLVKELIKQGYNAKRSGG